MALSVRSQPPPKAVTDKTSARWCFEGFLGGLLSWFIAGDLGLLDLLPFLRGVHLSFVFAGVLGALLGLTRAIWLERITTAILLILWLIVAFSLLASRIALPLKLEQAPEKAQAVVVLQAGIQKDNDFGAPTLERTLHGLELLHQGFAPRLVLTEVPSEGSHLKAAQELMKNLGIKGTVLTVGPVHTTHDEAVLVSHLMEQHSWKKILLVTSPTHSLRATRTFQKTGLEVVSSPCRESLFDLENLNQPLDRIRAFSSAIREIVGLRTYQSRGWA